MQIVIKNKENGKEINIDKMLEQVIDNILDHTLDINYKIRNKKIINSTDRMLMDIDTITLLMIHKYLEENNDRD